MANSADEGKKGNQSTGAAELAKQGPSAPTATPQTANTASTNKSTNKRKVASRKKKTAGTAPAKKAAGKKATTIKPGASSETTTDNRSNGKAAAKKLTSAKKTTREENKNSASNASAGQNDSTTNARSTPSSAKTDAGTGTAPFDTMTAAMNQWTDYWFAAAKKTLDVSMRSTDIGINLMANASPDPVALNFDVSTLFSSDGQSMRVDPTAVFNANFTLLQKQAELWAYATQRANGNAADPVASSKGDKRFKSGAWSEELVFDVLKQNYLLLSDWMLDLVNNCAPDLSEKERSRLAFMTRQMTDAMSPTNFAATNPDVIARTIDTKGENISAGLSNLQRDTKTGTLNIQHVNPNAFSVGENIAVTEGAVVFENDLIQLIQYSPTTEKTYEKPLLIIPPWINKFYILDLKPENSFIRWSVEQGLTVFVVSWRNVDSSMRETTFEDYMSKGILESLDAINKATGQSSVNAIGYCIGGTLLASTLARMSAQKDQRIHSATFFTTQVDFSEPGELGHFIDETQLNLIDQMMEEKGYLDGAEMSRTFNMLRSNDLIWSFWVNNYLLGRDALEFDLLYWNADTTRIPQRTHSFYLRQMYLENNLVKPGGITLGGEALHLNKIDIPVYLQAGREDHIAPWRSVIKAKQHYSGDVRFVLAGSGHIAGVVNPPALQKYCHWINDAEPNDPDQWDAGSREVKGSWWPDWIEWIRPMSGDLISARKPGDGDLQTIEAAPGRYVLER